MGKYLVDNNVISSYFANKFSPSAMDFVSSLIEEIPIISVITQIEALSWQNLKNESIVREFISECEILPLNSQVVKKCIEIRRNKKIKTPDAIIAASAIEFGLILLTSDKDFNNISELKVLDPMTL